MKKEWIEPQIMVQQFMANEYVATCWGVACCVGDGNYGGYGWERWGGVAPYGDQCHDHRGSCSSASNNQFNADEKGNVSFYAENNAQQGTLSGGYTSYIDINESGKVDGGDIIFWYTLGSADDRNYNGRRWNHYGTVVNADSSHPNRS